MPHFSRKMLERKPKYLSLHRHALIHYLIYLLHFSLTTLLSFQRAAAFRRLDISRRRQLLAALLQQPDCTAIILVPAQVISISRRQAYWALLRFSQQDARIAHRLPNYPLAPRRWRLCGFYTPRRFANSRPRAFLYYCRCMIISLALADTT